MKRYYFIGDDLNVVATVEKDLLTNGLADERVHVLSLDDVEAELRKLHDVQSLMKKDVIRSTEVGASLGLAASLLAIVIAHVTGIAATIGWLPFVFLAIVLLGFFTWEGGLIGIQMPNSRFRRFEKALRAGEHVLFVDTDEAQESRVQHILDHHPQMRPAGTGSPSPRWLVGLQSNAKRFFEWAP